MEDGQYMTYNTDKPNRITNMQLQEEKQKNMQLCSCCNTYMYGTTDMHNETISPLLVWHHHLLSLQLYLLVSECLASSLNSCIPLLHGKNRLVPLADQVLALGMQLPGLPWVSQLR